MFLARKISRAKWKPDRNLAAGEIQADAVTADLRTTGNELSFWRCDTGGTKEIEDAILAIASSGEHVETIDVVWIPIEDLEAAGLTLKCSDGRTPVRRLRERHVDVEKLDLVRLGKIADRVVIAIGRDRTYRLTKARVTKLLMAAIDRGDLEIADLEKKVQDEVRRGRSAAAER